jgi:hypothetical protein
MGAETEAGSPVGRGTAIADWLAGNPRPDVSARGVDDLVVQVDVERNGWA